MMKGSLVFLFVLLTAAPLASGFVVRGRSPQPAFSGKTQLHVEIASTSEVALGSRSEQLLAKAEDMVNNGFNNGLGFYSPANESEFSEEFVFRAPVIGPLNKKDYLFTMGSFNLFEAFPDLKANAWGFSIDPENPNKVWFMLRSTGTFENDLTAGPNVPSIKANGKKLNGCPETHSILFDDDMKVKALTGGYVADRFEGNTNGLGAVYGLLFAIGYKLPPPPFFRLFQELTNGLGGNPKSFSTDLPKWWIQEGRLND
jgi:hypothetical protein